MALHGSARGAAAALFAPVPCAILEGSRALKKKAVHHGKDLTQKFLSHVFRGRFLRHFGLGWVDVTGVAATEVAKVRAREQRLDFLFLLAGGSYLHLEFQSTTPADLRRFLAYDALLHERDGRSIRTVVFYSNGITTAQSGINSGAILYRVDNVFFAEFDADVRLDRLIAKAGREPFTPEDQLDLIFLAHMSSADRSPGQRVLMAPCAWPRPLRTKECGRIVLGPSWGWAMSF